MKKSYGSRWIILSRSLVLASLVVTSSSAWAGGATSGGGKGVRCADSYGVENLEVLDLHEGALRYGLNFRASHGELLADYKDAILHERELTGDHRPWSSQDTQDFNAIMSNQVHFLAPGGELPQLDDTGPVELKDGCELVQIAIYHDVDRSVTIDPLLWNRLSTQNQAALLVHEHLWFLGRSAGMPLSTLARLQTALLFSDSQLAEPHPTGGRNFTRCQAGTKLENGVLHSYSFALWEECDHTVIQLYVLGGTQLVSDTRFEVPMTGLALENSCGGIRVGHVSAPFNGDLWAAQGELALPNVPIQLHLEAVAGSPLRIGVAMPGLIESLPVDSCDGPLVGW